MRSAYGVAVRGSAPKPDISSVEAFKRALLNAKSITYLPVPGVPQLIERLELKDAIASKVTIPTIDISSELVAKGEIDSPSWSSHRRSPRPAFELAGLLPPEEFSSIQSFGGAESGFKIRRCRPGFARLPQKSRGRLAVIKVQGMEPI